MKDMGRSATFNSIVLALVSAFLITWVNEATTLKGYIDLVSFWFITKFVGTCVTLFGMNIYLAKQSFRPDDSLTREGEPDSKEVKDRLKKSEEIRNLLGLDPKE
jgi:hypothetical protein